MGKPKFAPMPAPYEFLEFEKPQLKPGESPQLINPPGAKDLVKKFGRQMVFNFWKMQRSELAKKLRKSKWGSEPAKEAKAILNWWQEMADQGKTWPQIQSTIKDYLVDEYEAHLRTIDEVTQDACKRNKPGAMMLAWGDPCRPQFNHKSANGYWEIRNFRRELNVTTTDDRTGVAWQVHRWYQRFWLRTTPAGMLNSMTAGVFVGSIVGSMSFMSSLAKIKTPPRSSPRLQESVNRQNKTNSRVNNALNSKSPGSNKWKMGDYFPESGMPENHVKVMMNVVDEMFAEGKPIAPIFRLTNRKSTPGIRKGYPAKGKDLQVNTSPKTGIVTARKKSDVVDAREAGYYVIDGDLVPRNKQGKSMDLGKRPGWKLEAGQVIDPETKLPIVGDYDLRGVIDLKSPGANVSLFSSDGKTESNRVDLLTKEFARRVNAKLDRPRVMHGAADQFTGLADEGALAMYPGQKTAFTNDGSAVKELYSRLNRKTVKGSYNPGQGTNPKPDIGPGGRNR